MSNAISIIEKFTPEQMKLITDVVARGATRDELQLFLYRCESLGLDPLKPGQIHFVKYGDGPGTIVIGIDGFRIRSERTGKKSGVKRGILRDEKGKCIGAWAEVYRKDWNQPAREEVPLSEYFKPGRNGKPSNWEKMPETMIKKVAEVAALRMAFPDDLEGLYSDDEIEIDLTEPRTVNSTAVPAVAAAQVPPPPEPKPVVRTKRVVGAEILAFGEEINKGEHEMTTWAAEHAKVSSASEMSLAQLEAFLEHVKYEAGRNGWLREKAV